MSSEFITGLKKVAKEKKQKLVEENVQEDFGKIIDKVIEVMTLGENKLVTIPVYKYHALELLEKLRENGFKADLHPRSDEMYECHVEWD